MSGPRRITSSRDPLKKGWEYRFTDPLTRKQTTRIHWFGSRRDADDAHQAYLENRRGQAIGLPDTSGWQLPYDQLVTKFLDGAPPNDDRRAVLQRVLERNELGLVVASDLSNTQRLTQHCRRLVDADPQQWHYVTHYLQGFLKQLSAWAKQFNVLPQDPLAGWKKLPKPKTYRPAETRAFTPQEFHALLAAAAEYDRLSAHENPSGLVIQTLLFSGSRPSAMFEAKVKDFRHGRVHLPEGNGKKRNGYAMLPPEFCAALEADLTRRGAEPDDPLLLSHHGGKIHPVNFGKYVSRCITLAFTRMHWPAGVPDASLPEHRDNPAAVEPAELAYLIFNDRPRGFDGPAPIDAGKRASRALRTQLLEKLNLQIGADVRRRSEGLYLYRLRHTHETWAQISGVSQLSIDVQIGHAGKNTGRRFYTDLKLVDPAASARAVYQMLAAARPAALAQPALKVVGAEDVPEVVSGVVPTGDTRKNSLADSAFKTPQSPELIDVGEKRVKGFEPSTSTLARSFAQNAANGGERSSSVVSFDKTPDQPAAKGASRCLTDATTSIQTSTQSKNPLSDSLLTQLDMRLQRLIAQWEDLPEHVRQAIDLMNRKAGE